MRWRRRTVRYLRNGVFYRLTGADKLDPNRYDRALAGKPVRKPGLRRAKKAGATPF
jgi:hypothetical protein